MVKVIVHSDSTIEDLLDYIKPIARKQLDILKTHTGINDLTNGVNMMEVRKLVRCIRDIDESEEINIGIVGRPDRNLQMEIRQQHENSKAY